jgi:peptidoglycan hydrolase-like amidase
MKIHIAAMIALAAALCAEETPPLKTANLLKAQALALRTAVLTRNEAQKQLNDLITETCKQQLKIEDAQVKDCEISPDLTSVRMKAPPAKKEP